jgi:hypothetical protein
VNAIPISRRCLVEEGAIAVYDIDGCVRSWGRRGILLGGLTGFVLGAIFVANPFTARVLTFGIAGTLIVCTMECAAIAGGFAVLIAALHGHGVLRNSATGLKRTFATGCTHVGVNWREKNVRVPEKTNPW